MSVSVTFDDGLRTFYGNALPLMRRWGYVATVYVIAGLVDSTWENQPTMNLAQLRELERSGWEIGSHSVSHRHMPRLPDEEKLREAKQSKELLEAEGFNVQSFAYPHGYFEGCKEIVEPFYRCARSAHANCFHPHHRTGMYNTYISVDRASFIDDYALPVNLPSPLLFREVKSRDAWVILVFHSIGPEGPTSEEKLSEVLYDMKTAGLKVVTLIDGFNDYRNKLEDGLDD